MDKYPDFNERQATEVGVQFPDMNLKELSWDTMTASV